MEKLIITAKDKESLYRELLPQIASLVSGETDLIANMANTAAALMEAFGFLWVGFYLVKPVHDEHGRAGENPGVRGSFQDNDITEDAGRDVSAGAAGYVSGTPGADFPDDVPSGAGNYELVLGPFQGPLACTRIPYGRGVCGSAWKERKTLIVPDVEAFPGHIACSSLSRSEIVVPVLAGGNAEEVSNRRVLGVLDIDSKEPGTFDETDRKYLEEIAALFAK